MLRRPHRQRRVAELRTAVPQRPQFRPSKKQPSPVRSGQAFVSIRTIKPSPFGDGRIYYGGYDNDFHPADGAAWIASSTSAALRLGGDQALGT